MHRIYPFHGECVQIPFIVCVADSKISVFFGILNEIVHMKPLVTKRKAMWGPKAMGAKVLVFTFKNAGT